MRSWARLRLHVVKEARELFSAWVACLAAIVTPWIAGEWPIEIALLVYGFATTGLGALVIGHEYAHGTVSVLLAQPVSRRRLLATKMSVLAVMLAPMAYLFWVVFQPSDFFRTIGLSPLEGVAALVLPVLGALLMAPWLTMVTRSAVAGAVFTMSMPGVPVVVADLLHAVTGSGAPTARFFLWESLAICSLAGVVGYRSFMQLEAIDGPGSIGRLPNWLQRRSSVGLATRAMTRTHPAWLLLSKELHLQRMTFVVAALYCVGWMVAVLLSSRLTQLALDIFYIMSVFHALEIALLSGSLASAEERQIGTLEWQLVTPLAASTQWLIKTAVVLVTTAALGCALPAVAASLASPGAQSVAPGAVDFVGLNMMSSALFIAAVSLYASSLSSSSLRAIFAAIPALAVTMSLGVYFGLFYVIGGRTVTALLLKAIVIIVLLASAMRNHRSLDRDPVRILKQCAFVATVVAAASAATFFVSL